MPTLSLTLSGANGAAHDWNQVSTPFTEVETFLNTTKIDYNNIQDNGVRPTQVRSIANMSGGRAKIRNATGGSVAAATIVGIAGTYSDGATNYPTIVAADSAAEASWIPARGIIIDTVANNADGTMATEYELSGVNTSSKSVHDPVYLSTTAGSWTLTAPTGDNIIQIIGFVSVSHASTGRIVFSFPGIVLPYGISSTGNLATKGTVTVGVDDAGHDITFYGDTASKKWVWDTSADKMIVTGEASVSGTFNLGTVAAAGSDTDKFLVLDGSGNVDYRTGTEVLSDIGAASSASGSGDFSGPGSSTDNAVVRFDGTGGKTGQTSSVLIDDSQNITGAANITLSGELDAATLDISGNADIDGVTNLDAVDIDGAVQIDSTVSIGVDDQGYDVKFFGDTASAYLLWDTSADKLLTAGGATVDIVKDKLLIGGTAVTTTAAELNVLDAVTAGTVTASLGVVVDSNKDIGSFRNITLTGELDAGSLDVSGDADIDGTLEADAITIGGAAIGTIYSPVAGHSSIATVGTITTGTFSGVLDASVTMTQGSDATGDIYYRNASGHLTRLAASTDGYVLTATGAGSVPAWEAASSGATLSGSTNNTVATVTGSNALIGEANLLFASTGMAIGNATILGAASLFGSAIVRLGGNGFFGTQPSAAAGNGLHIGVNCHYDSDDSWETISDDEAARIQIQDGAYRFYTAPSPGSAGGDIVWTERMRLDVSGNLGIAMTPGGSHELDVTGSAGLSTGTAWTNTSDVRIKENVATITGAVDKLKRLRPVSFRYTDQYLSVHGEIDGSKTYNSFVADEYAAVFPDAVSTQGDLVRVVPERNATPEQRTVLLQDLKQYTPHDLPIYLVRAIQELDARIAALE